MGQQLAGDQAFLVMDADIAAARAMQPATARKPMDLFVVDGRFSLRMTR